MKYWVFFFLFLGITSSAQAGILLELGGTYIDGTLAGAESQKSAQYFYQVGLLFDMNKKIWGGWNYSGLSQNDSGDKKITFTSMDTGPYFKWQFGRNEIFNLGLAYNILSRATYKNDDANESWQGASFWIQFGVMPEIKEGFHIGASINYYSASYTKKTVDSVESSDSNSKTWIFPMLSLTKQW